VATHSTVPDEVERGDKLIESRELMIISLVLDVLICISLLAVQVSTEVKYDEILLISLVLDVLICISLLAVQVSRGKV